MGHIHCHTKKEPEDRFSSVYQFRQALEVCEEVLIKRTENPDFHLTLSLDNGQLVRSDGKPITSDAETSATMVFTPQKTKEATQRSNEKGSSRLVQGTAFAIGLLVVIFFSFYMFTEQETQNEPTVQKETQVDEKDQNAENGQQSEEIKDKLEVRISSTPSGAIVKMTDVNGEKMVVGNTPFLMSLQLSNIKFLEIEMSGYTSQKILPSLSNVNLKLYLKNKKEDQKKIQRKQNEEKYYIQNKSPARGQ